MRKSRPSWPGSCAWTRRLSRWRRIKKDLGADSLDILQLLMRIEDQYGITIPDKALATFKTVGDVVAYLEQEGTQI